jgi:nucleoid-associated protein YgaU
MLVIRKEVKVGLGIAAAVLGVAVIYGGMSMLTSKPSDDVVSFTPGDAATLEVGGSALEEAVSGLPPREGAEADTATASRQPVGDIFAESSRTDGAATTDKWATAWSTGRVNAAVRTETPAPESAVGLVVADATGPTDPVIRTATPTESASADTTATAATSGAPTSGTYTIAAGDTYSSIAAKLYGNRNLYHVIEKANPTVDPRKLKVGQKINVPASSTVATVAESVNDTRTITGAIDTTKQYRVQPGDTLHKVSQKLYGKTKYWAAIYDANKQAIGPDAGRIKIGMVLNLPQIPTAD